MKCKQFWEEGTNERRWGVVSAKLFSTTTRFLQTYVYFTVERPRTVRGAEIETRCKQRARRRKKETKSGGREARRDPWQ